jgi:trypsin
MILRLLTNCTCVMAILCAIMMQCCDAATDPRIVGGTPAADGDFPFHVASVGSYLCGGTLIYEDIVLTAAHCGDAFLDGVYIGGVLFGMDAVDVVSVDQEFPHPYFDPDTLINDIMLVKLTAPATSPLVTLNFDPTVPAEGDVVTAIGFGDTVFEGMEQSDILLLVDVDVYSDEFCALPDPDYDPPTMICAGTAAGGRDSCQGDSGGPLLTSTNVQIGIVSYGEGCGLPDVPSVYTDVAAFQLFIRAGICSKYFFQMLLIF